MLQAAALGALTVGASLTVALQHQLEKRAFVTADEAVSKSYDYIVVGGGNAGLVVAGRLSENSSATVLVIEAGTEPSDQIQQSIDVPALAYLDGATGSDWDWGYQTTEQAALNGRQVSWPRGKVLGGSSAINGLYLTRAAKLEYDAWDSLQNDSMYSWDWDAVYPYLKKMENYHEPSSRVEQVTEVVYDISAHGTDGPIHYSQGGYPLAQEGLWMNTWESMGFDAQETYGGETWGPRICASSINPSNWTRSYSRTGYLDPYAYRTNLDVLTGNQVTKINFEAGDDNDQRAVSVNFAASQDATEQTVSANREIILAAGVIGSPQLLEVSGVGARSLLEGLDIDVVIDLPGVGEHLTDHVSTGFTFRLNADQYPVSGDLLRSNDTFREEQMSLWQNGQGAQSLYSTPNEPLTYLSLSDLMGNQTDSILSDLKANMTAARDAMTWADETVRAGFEAVFNLEADVLLPSKVGAVEFLQANLGYGSGDQGITFTFQAAAQHTVSQGYVHITSASVWDYPDINPNYLANDFDMQLMIAALRYVDQVAGTSPMSDAITGRVEPEQLSSDEEYKSFVRERSGTEYHPAMSCSMLPRELGGVVDTSLKVYGTNNLRIADSSIIPIGISAHLQEPTYGIGEYAAAIISGNAQQKSDDDDHDEDNASSAGSSTVDNNANKAADDESSATTWSTFSAAGLISFTLLSWLL